MAFNDDVSSGMVRHNISLLRYDAQLRRQIRGYLRNLQDQITLQLGSYDFSDVAKRARLEALQKQVDDIIRGTYKQMNRTMLNELSDLAGVEHQFASQQLNGLVGVDIVSAGLAPAQLRALTKNSPIFGSPAQEWWGRQSASLRRRFADEMRQGFTLGESTGDLVRRVRGTATGARQIVEIGGKTKSVPVFEGGIMNVSTREAEALVRTSVQSVANEARMATYMANTDVIKSVQAQVTLDQRTSDICIAHGAIPDEWTLPDMEPVGGSGPFLGPPPWHWNCRSSLTPVTKSWEELQGQNATRDQRKIARVLDNNAPKRMRASMNGQVPRSMGYDAWLKKQKKSVQLEVLGPTKHALWKKGHITLGQMIDQTGRPMSIGRMVGQMDAAAVVPKTGTDILGKRFNPKAVKKVAGDDLFRLSVYDFFKPSNRGAIYQVMDNNGKTLVARRFNKALGQMDDVKASGGVKTWTNKSPTAGGPSTATVKRAKDFKETGNYIVTRADGRKFTIFRDPDTKWWYNANDLNGPNRGLLGFTRKEAVEKLEKGTSIRIAKRGATRTAPTAPTTPGPGTAFTEKKAIKELARGTEFRVGKKLFRVRSTRGSNVLAEEWIQSEGRWMTARLRQFNFSNKVLIRPGATTPPPTIPTAGVKAPPTAPLVSTTDYASLKVGDIFKDAAGNVWKVGKVTSVSIRVGPWSNETGRFLHYRKGKSLKFSGSSTSKKAVKSKNAYTKATKSSSAEMWKVFDLESGHGGANGHRFSKKQLDGLSTAVKTMSKNGFGMSMSKVFQLHRFQVRAFTMGKRGSLKDVFGGRYGHDVNGAYWSGLQAMGMVDAQGVRGLAQTWTHEFGHHLDYMMHRNQFKWLGSRKISKQARSALDELESAYAGMRAEFRTTAREVGKKSGVRNMSNGYQHSRSVNGWSLNIRGRTNTTYSLYNEKEWFAEQFSAYFNLRGSRTRMRSMNPATYDYFETLFSKQMEPLWKEMLRLWS